MMYILGFNLGFQYINADVNYVMKVDRNTGCPKEMETKTGEEITSKLGQPLPKQNRFLKAHLVDIKCV